MTGKQQRTFWRFLLACAATFAIVMAILPHPPQVTPDVGDKANHMLAFATLAILSVLAYPAASLLRIAGKMVSTSLMSPKAS